MDELIKNEKVEYKTSASIKANLKNTILANLIYIIMWIAFDVFFIYIISMKSVAHGFWLVTITVCGLNLLLIWTFVFKVLKVAGEIKNTGYILTDKAFYYYNDGKYKELKRIAYDDIMLVEKSEYFVDGFFVASENDFIKVINILDENEMFSRLAQKVSNTNTQSAAVESVLETQEDFNIQESQENIPEEESACNLSKEESAGDLREEDNKLEEENQDNLLEDSEGDLSEEVIVNNSLEENNTIKEESEE